MRFLAPAKINLFLKIKWKRPDSYHDIKSLFCAVSLFDWVSVKIFKENKIVVFCDDVLVPRTRANLIYKSVDLFLKKIKSLGIYFRRGVRVYIWKKIPIGSGFGGGSSNAASVILFLNKKFGYPFSICEMVEIGKEIGADVPFFILRKPAIVSGIGDRLKYVKLKLPKFVVLVYTGSQIFTKSVYKSFNFKRKIELTKEIKKFSSGESFPFRCRSNFLNDLDYSSGTGCYTFLKKNFYLLDLEPASYSMSGSGSGLFLLYTDFVKARLAGRLLLRFNRKWFVKVVSLLN